MFNSIVHKFQYGQNTIVLESGLVARQANAAVMVSMDDTTVLVTVVSSNEIKSECNFLPLFVHYQERTYAAGRFPGGFFRREGRPSESEILTSRLIDRPIRPLFPEGFFYDVQIMSTVISVNPQVNPDIVALIGVSTVLGLSDLPCRGPIGVARVGYVNKQYILNPTTSQLSESLLDLVIVGTENMVLMVESEAKLLKENQILDAIMFGHEQQQTLIKNINDFVAKAGKLKLEWQPPKVNVDLQNRVTKLAKAEFKDACFISNKQERILKLNSIKNNIINLISPDYAVSLYNDDIKSILNNFEKKVIRNHIFQNNSRIDGRNIDMVRDLDIRIGVLPRTHGSALFTRGETQALVTVTLGTERNAQNIDELTGERIDRFLLHYNFPSYCVGEIGLVGSPKRREIGHGCLAKRSILAVMPKVHEFPYTVRVVSEITESNGSSSMASVCGASLALMDAGVPIKTGIAGVAMGLIKEKDSFIVLSDILGDEDHLGDVDFKISGNYEGITALQMDVKIEGITRDMILAILHQAKDARSVILTAMEKIIKVARNDISIFAPRIHTIKINPEKIKNVIGKGGSVIRTLTEETGTTIDIEDDGTVKIAAVNNGKLRHVINRIKEITSEIEIGCIYNGRVTNIVDFGAFVAICGGKEGLVHISQLSNKRVNKVTDYLKLGQKVLVKVLDVDRLGRIRLSIKDVNISI